MLESLKKSWYPIPTFFLCATTLRIILLHGWGNWWRKFNYHICIDNLLFPFKSTQWQWQNKPRFFGDHHCTDVDVQIPRYWQSFFRPNWPYFGKRYFQPSTTLKCATIHKLPERTLRALVVVPGRRGLVLFIIPCLPNVRLHQ